MDIFISYSHRDEQWLDRLTVHLKAVENAENILSFSDRRIQPGDAWREEIREAMEAAKVAVFLVSADFLASDFIRAHELPPLLAREKAGGTTIMPIIVSPSLFEETEDLSRFQTLNPPSKPWP